VKALKSGVNVPGLRCLDLESGVLGIEWIKGQSVREVLGVEAEGAVQSEAPPATCAVDIGQEEMMAKIGQQIARLHAASIIHSDLTTSNMLIAHDTLDCILIDFGLAYVSTLVEDKAVDLYVLERAFLSTHPSDAKSIHRSEMFEQILESYAAETGDKAWKLVKTRLDDVRMRGRKRSMVG
jgi:TP53 regulating kinase-like protein